LKGRYEARERGGQCVDIIAMELERGDHGKGRGDQLNGLGTSDVLIEEVKSVSFKSERHVCE
jgi:hypothetical protein